MRRKYTLFLLLSVIFLDYMGLGLVFPLFAALFFDPQMTFLAAETSGLVRGMMMGGVIALTPLFLFIGSPIFGALSDQRGRRALVLTGLLIAAGSYLIGMIGMKMGSLWLLVLYRVLFGIGMSTTPVVQAAIVDISTPETKAKYLGLYSMALALGFASGPVIGGHLSNPELYHRFNFGTPFFVAAILTLASLLLFYFGYKESGARKETKKINPLHGLVQVRKAFTHPHFRVVFLSFFLFLLGWDYFIQFVAVILTEQFSFSTSQSGTFFAFNSFTYACATGIFIRPFIKRFSTTNLLTFSMLFAPLFLPLFLTIKNPVYLLLFLPVMNFIVALYFPVAMTHISNSRSEEHQGEILGVYQSVVALGFLVGPLMGGFIGILPSMSVYLGSSLMGLGGLIFTGHRIWKRNVANRPDEAI